MRVGKKKCVIKKKMMQYDEFMERIKKSFYYGDESVEENIELTSPLAEYASELFSEPQKGNSLQRLTKFSAGNVRVPNPCSLIMALIYLDRLNEVNPGYVRNGITPSDLFLVSVVVSSKFCYDDDEDSTFYLDDFLQDCDTSLEHYKKLEMEFLCAIDWNIYISNENFQKKLETIEKFLAKREGIRRGWLTYTELLHFLPSFTLAKFLLNNITVMAVSYVASVMTMAGAFFLVSNIPGNGLLQINRNQIRNKLSCENDIVSQSTQKSNDIINSTTGSNEQHNINDNNIGKQNTNNNMAVVNHSSDIMIGNINIINNNGLNIENELKKLEDEYKYEKMLELRKQNNEYDGPLINFYENYIIQDKLYSLVYGMNTIKGTTFNDVLINYQDYQDNNNNKNNNSNEDDINGNANLIMIFERLNDIRNYTKSIFWDLIYNAEKSFKTPLIWFKFI
ncbi:formin-J [Condylostylus longicornis]|uniref:formin-J n=1 Tax=Condylostylus longicornis TaxID=2530218 RepID=UPI00244E14E3|nr:formin-J [Condylostylus longicornis]